MSPRIALACVDVADDVRESHSRRSGYEFGVVKDPESLCHRCVAAREVRTKTSVFVLCTAIPDRKYPPQPVTQCELFHERPEKAR